MKNQWPRYTIIGILAIFFIILILYGITGRAWIAELTAAVVLGCLALANYFTMKWHGTFLTAEDIYNVKAAGSVISSYRFSADPPVGRILLFVILTLGLSAAAFVIRKKRPVLHRPWYRLFLGAASLYGLFMLYFAPQAVIPKDAPMFWDWCESYAVLGYFSGTVESLRISLQSQVDRPDGYSDAHAAELAAQLCAELEQESAATSVSEPQAYPDIFLILNETWFDFDYFYETGADADYMYQYDHLENAVTGHTVIPITGGGTNASEYEMLTSNSLELLHVYSPFNCLNLTGRYSIVSHLKDLGYVCMAAHPHPSEVYHRGNSYRQLGFDVTHFQDDFTDTGFYAERRGNNRITDISAFQNLIRFYDELPEDRPRFSFLVTMQNHGGWSNLSEENYLVRSDPADGDDNFRAQLNEVLSCEKLTDDMIACMVDYFSALYEESGRKVVVCMAGDHAPSIMRSLGGKYGHDWENDLKGRATPFFIWANYPIGQEDAGDIDLCYLAPMLVRTAGLPLSGYYQYLLDMQKTISVFTNVQSDEGDAPGRGFIDQSGQFCSLQEADESAVNMLQDYFCLEYNSCGKRVDPDPALFTPVF